VTVRHFQWTRFAHLAGSQCRERRGDIGRCSWSCRHRRRTTWRCWHTLQTDTTSLQHSQRSSWLTDASAYRPLSAFATQQLTDIVAIPATTTDHTVSHSNWWWCHDIGYPLLDADHSLCTAPWSGTPCRTTSTHSRTMSPFDRACKPGFSPDTSVFSALETFVIIALYKSTFTIPYHTIQMVYTQQRDVMVICNLIDYGTPLPLQYQVSTVL